jgi:hypothetical protein
VNHLRSYPVVFDHPLGLDERAHLGKGHLQLQR